MSISGSQPRRGTLAREQKLEAAFAKFEVAIQTAPWFAKTYYNAGLVLDQMGLPQEALTHYISAQQTFLLSEDETETLTRIVALVQRNGIATPQAADDHYRMGIVRAEQKKYPEAIREFQAALATAPWIVDAYYNLGLVYEFTGEYPDALRVYSIYAQLAPTGPNIGTAKTKIVKLKDQLGMLGTTPK